MYFLNPAILIALSAVSIPVLIHFFNLQKIKKVEFSTLMFLKELQKSKIKRINLKQLLLLFLRIMIIVLLVLAFAKPVFKGYAADTVDAKKTVLIILDNSFSLAAKDNSVTFFEQAKNSVKKILGSHSESDDIFFISSSDIRFKDRRFSFSSKREMLDSLNKAEISFKPAEINEQLNLAEEIFNTSVNQINEMYIVSDFQRGNFYKPSGGSKENYQALREKNVNLFLVDAGEREVNNISLDSIYFISKLFEKDRDVRLKVTVNNHTKFSVTNKIVRLYVNEKLIEEKAIDINSREKKELEFSFKPERTGFVSGRFELFPGESNAGFTEDEIKEDNRFYFTAFIPSHFKIGITESGVEDSKYIRLAFSSAMSFLSEDEGKVLFDLSPVSITTTINSLDVLFISGKNSFTLAETEVLRDYVTNGGGIFIFPPANADIKSYNDLLTALGSSRMLSLNSNDAANTSLKFDRIDFEHPVLSEVFQNKNLSLTSRDFNIESPQIKSYFEILAGDNSSAIISLSNGNPFLISSRINKGKILLSAVSSTTNMSDFPLKSLFLPIIIRSTYYLGNNYYLSTSNFTGQNNFVMVKGINQTENLITPENKSYEMKASFNDSRDNFISIPYTRMTSQPGVYKLTNGEKTSEFSLNHVPSESNTEKMPESELKEFFNGQDLENVYYVEPGEEISSGIKEARTGMEIWKYLLAAALLFLAAEIFLSRRMSISDS